MKGRGNGNGKTTTGSLLEKHIEAGLCPADLKYLKESWQQQGEPERVLFNGLLLAIE